MTANKMSANGISICATGEENYEKFVAGAFRGKEYYQYDYRHPDGELFSVVMPTLRQCRERRDIWLAHRIARYSSRQEIRQNGATVLENTDGETIPAIFSKLVGRLENDPDEYRIYITCTAIPAMGFDYGEIELVADGLSVLTGTIRRTL